VGLALGHHGGHRRRHRRDGDGGDDGDDDGHGGSICGRIAGSKLLSGSYLLAYRNTTNALIELRT
jgi:hypothetical protein